MSGKRFGLIGAAGYVAPRHMDAIQMNNCDLIAAMDPNDSVGMMDSYFPEALYFNNFERFERHINKLRIDGTKVDYLSICSPNYLHDTHCRFALNNEMDAICEKPLVLNPWNLDALQTAEEKSGLRIFNILQLRLHPVIRELKKQIDQADENTIHEVSLNYITSRGPWYHISWKGQNEKSGGISTNIGIHFFDMLIWLFGEVKENILVKRDLDHEAGILILEKARVNWFLSVNKSHLNLFDTAGKRTYRSLTMNDKEIEFSDGFENLHIESYRKILGGQGFSTQDVRPAIELVSNLRTQDPDEKLIQEHAVMNKLND
jgi:UDP-N-acetyl-2-amino-2-deoxyglucuronate dehydrogenase